ncbi:MAG: DUF5106 domain-containing protein [Muribaculaceae bacterium]|nr:DUF5106 domain-containing protein [Muribaculaceae bacterium]
MKFKRLINLIILLVTCFGSTKAVAQEVIEIEPLFEYPEVPDELTTLTDRTGYLVKNFWNNLDTKNQQAVDQIALNHAFSVFCTSLRWADQDLSLQSVEKLIDKISNNPVLLVQMAKAAKENLYGPNAEYWSDILYLKFLDAAIKNKKVSESRKERYRKEAEILRSTLIGNKAPSFSFEEPDGKISQYFPMSTPTLIIFGDPENTDWRMVRLGLEINTELNQAIDKGKLNVLYIVNSSAGDWKKSVDNYTRRWKVGKGIDLDEKYDMRLNPSVYLIGSDGAIQLKNSPLQTAVNQALEIVN